MKKIFLSVATLTFFVTAAFTYSAYSKETTKLQKPATLNIAWGDFHSDAKLLAAKLKSKGKFDAIVAVTRGGLVPAAVVASELGIRMVDTICVSSYDGKRQGQAEILKNISLKNGNILVIDDLVDTGKTMELVRKVIPNSHVATVYAKPKGRKTADTFVKEISQDSWIVFPWENYNVAA